MQTEQRTRLIHAYARIEEDATYSFLLCASSHRSLVSTAAYSAADEGIHSTCSWRIPVAKALLRDATYVIIKRFCRFINTHHQLDIWRYRLSFRRCAYENPLGIIWHFDAASSLHYAHMPMLFTKENSDISRYLKAFAHQFGYFTAQSPSTRQNYYTQRHGNYG